MTEETRVRQSCIGIGTKKRRLTPFIRGKRVKGSVAILASSKKTIGKSMVFRLAEMADMQVVQTCCSMSALFTCQATKLEKRTTSASRSSSRFIICCIPQICRQIFFISKFFCSRSGLSEQSISNHYACETTYTYQNPF